MQSKTAAFVNAALRALSSPRLAVLAMQERGPRYVIETLRNSTPAELVRIVHDLQFRALDNTRDNLVREFGTALAGVDDEDAALLRVQLRAGGTFLIRKAQCLSDMKVLYETFVLRIYDVHPALRGQTVLDVGANLGDTAVYFALQGARVVAFEPSDELCALATRNAELNGVTIELHNEGIGCMDHTLPLTVGRAGANPMSTTLFPGGIESRNRQLSLRVPVRVVALADVIERYALICFVKMDCEGCEYPALLNLSRERLRSVAHVCLEYHDRPEPLRERLEGAGFVVRMNDGRLMVADRTS